MKLLKELIRNPISLIGLALIVFFTLLGIAAPWLAPTQPGYDRYEIPRDGFSMEPKSPSKRHPFGTAEGQYDIFYGVVWGTRTAFRIGLFITLCISIIGVIIGTIAGYFGGIIDELIMRVVDIFMAFPRLVAAMTLTTILGKGLDNVMIALIAFGWMGYARLIRSEILSLKEESFIEASKAIGSGDVRTICKHIIPNSIYPVFVMASLDIGSMVLWAAILSFLGLGAEIGYADWGQLISFTRNWIIGPPGEPLKYWYTVFFPGTAILLFVLGWNLVGDAFRDLLDPKMQV